MPAAAASTKDARRRQYRSCDHCRVGKRACNAVYESVTEAINNKVSCSNCHKKGKTCSFQYVLSILGGIPGGSTQDLLSSGSCKIKDNASLNGNADNAEKDDEELKQRSTRSKAVPSTDLAVVSGSPGRSSATATSGPFLMQATARTTASTAFENVTFISPLSSTTRITTTIDRIFLNDGLIRVYEGAAEQALRCWITSSNTPYMLADRSPTASSAAPSQQLVYWRICELDRGARNLLGHHGQGSASREKEIMDAFHSVVLAFAAQWSPHWITSLSSSSSKTSNNKVRLALWERARSKLQQVANLDSFRVIFALIIFALIIFALIIFAWTEKPREVLDRADGDGNDVDLNGENCALDTSSWQSPAEGSTFLLVAAMRKLLSIKFKIEGRKRRGGEVWCAPNGKVKTKSSSTHVTAALGQARDASGTPGNASGETSDQLTMAKQIQTHLKSKGPASCSRIDEGSANVDVARSTKSIATESEVARMEGTYHMLYWLCVVIDTETSVLRKYPPVVCDEDSEVMSSVLGASFLEPSTESSSSNPSWPAGGSQRSIWDDYIIDISKRKQLLSETSSSWPCDPAKAAATLAFSTPVKVVMFRQISRLQMSFWRRASASTVEQHIRSGLGIFYHWNQCYGRLIDSCRASHASLPASIQSWHTLLAFPWYLAVLLFVEMVQTVDMAGSSDPQARFERAQSGIFPRLRDRACSDLCLLISAIQTTSFNHLETTFQYVRDSGGNLLLTEPWSEILVHSITAVIKTEVKLHEGYRSLFKWKELEESQERIEKCLWALKQLEDKSPAAAMAYEELEGATNKKRREQGSWGLGRVPLASPPLQREAVISGGGGEGPSPGSDTDNNRASCYGSVGSNAAEVGDLGFGELPAFDHGTGQAPLDSALTTYFAATASASNLSPTQLAPSELQATSAQLGATPSQSDYLHLLQMTSSSDASIQPLPPAPPSSLPELHVDASAGSSALSIEPLSILETLAQLTNQPMRDMVPLSSDVSSSSIDTAFSLDSAEWGMDFSSSNNIATCIHSYNAAPASDATSVSSGTDSDTEEQSSIVPSAKRAKHVHPASSISYAAMLLQFSALAQQHRPLPNSMTMAMSLGQQYTSIPLQPAAQRRGFDDLYGDDDDDDLISLRDVLKRKRDEHVSGDVVLSVG